LKAPGVGRNNGGVDHQETAGTAGYCPFRIDRPVMWQRWARLTFLHWSFEPEAVQRLLPDGLVADLFDNVAWVGLVPFYMNVATAGRPLSPNAATAGRQAHPTGGTGGGLQVPWVSRFCETNVRTYVRDEQGRAGIWFFSLDAARLGAVAVARTTYRLPYFWSAMRIIEHGHPGSDDPDDDLPGEITYRCRRRLPGPRGATSEIRVRVGNRYQPDELSERDHFLTARWILFSAAGTAGTAGGSGPSGSGVSPGGTVAPRASTARRLARACHDPWPLYRAEAVVVRDQLITAARLPEPQGAPLVHYSPGVDVTIGRPERMLVP
jgi:uncharacterized protein